MTFSLPTPSTGTGWNIELSTFVPERIDEGPLSAGETRPSLPYARCSSSDAAEKRATCHGAAEPAARRRRAGAEARRRPIRSRGVVGGVVGSGVPATTIQMEGNMKAVTWHGKRDVRVEAVPDPKLEQPTDAIVRITSTAICGSDLHLYELFGPFLEKGDILGHEPMGIVEEVGSEVTHIQPGDRVVIPFNISCGHCWMCQQQLFAQCETTQVTSRAWAHRCSVTPSSMARCPAVRPRYLRVPQAQFGPIRVPQGPPDERFLFLSDVLPTAWQAVEYAAIPEGGSVVVFGLGPIGQMSARVARYRGARVIGVDLVPERLDDGAPARYRGGELGRGRRRASALRELTGGRGPDSVIDAVGIEAHGSAPAQIAQALTGLLRAPSPSR